MSQIWETGQDWTCSGRQAHWEVTHGHWDLAAVACDMLQEGVKNVKHNLTTAGSQKCQNAICHHAVMLSYGKCLITVGPWDILNNFCFHV